MIQSRSTQLQIERTMLTNKKKKARIVGTLVITTCLMLGVVWLLGHLLLAMNPNSSTLIASEGVGSSIASTGELANKAVDKTTNQHGFRNDSDTSTNDASSTTHEESNPTESRDDSLDDLDHGIEPLRDRTAQTESTGGNIDFRADVPKAPPATTIEFSDSVVGSDIDEDAVSPDSDPNVDIQIDFEDDNEFASTTSDPIEDERNSRTNTDWANSNPLADVASEPSPVGSHQFVNNETNTGFESPSFANNATNQGEASSEFSTTPDINSNRDITTSKLQTSELTPEPASPSQTLPKVDAVSPRYKPEIVERKIPSANTPVAAKEYPVRTWTSRDQKQVQASYVSQDKDSVILLVRGKLYRVPFSRFMQGDLDYLKHVATKSQKAP